MKYVFLFFLSGISMMNFATAQKISTDSLGFETFTYVEGDTSYTMKKYFMAFLKKGNMRSHSKEEAVKIQKQHMEHIRWMGSQGYVDIAGPFADDGEIRGILVLNVPNQEKAEQLAAMDPAVKAGRLVVEVHPWWAAVGSKLR